MTQAYLYKWTEKSTGMWYIGSRTAHNCHINDGYICSSKVVKPKILANRDDWIREILCIGYPKYIVELETKYLTVLDAANAPMSYNQHNGGKWSTTGKTHTKEARKRISESQKGKILSEETRKKLSDAQKQYWQKKKELQCLTKMNNEA